MSPACPGIIIFITSWNKSVEFGAGSKKVKQASLYLIMQGNNSFSRDPENNQKERTYRKHSQTVTWLACELSRSRVKDTLLSKYINTLCLWVHLMGPLSRQGERSRNGFKVWGKFCRLRSNERRLSSHTMGARIPGPPFTCCAILGQQLHIPSLWFLQLSSGGNNSTFLTKGYCENWMRSCM